MAFSIIVTILAFGVMVVLHEAGHFFVAKKFGVTVHEFSIGMGPRLLKWGKGETEYSLRLLPLGGYVKLEGEDEESDNPRAFSNISPVKRICILVAGATMNVLLGFLCFVVINSAVGRVATSTISFVDESSGAYQEGLRAGDSIVKLDNTPVATHNDMLLYMSDPRDEVKVTYVREGERHIANVKTTKTEDGRYILGVNSTVKDINFIEGLKYSLYDTRYVVRAVMYSLKQLVTGGAKISDLSGPVGIVQVVSDTTEAASQTGSGLYVFLTLMNIFGMISVNLGVFNLLPFPALDGGSIIFAFVELVTRKKLKREILGYINLIGLVLILGLGIFVMYSDIMKLF